MRVFAFFTILSVTFPVAAQSIPANPLPEKKVGATVVAVTDASDRGTVSGRTYTNHGLAFEVTFPDTWLIPGDDFEDYMKSNGFDVSLKPSNDIGKASKLQLDRYLQNVQILLTAYRSMPGTADNGIVRISTEDIRLNPGIKDAVDYFDLMRSQLAVMKLPADFRYSETQAEQLGSQQFGFLDTSSNSGKKRLYATVRNGVAIMFTLSYTKPDDLKTFRDVLAKGNFALKRE
jgi:hypothetical protein